MPVYRKGMVGSVYGSRGKSTIVMYFFNLIRAKPSCLQLAQEVLESGIVQKCLVSFVEDFILNERIMPFSSLLLDQCSVLECREPDFIQLIDLL